MIYRGLRSVLFLISALLLPAGVLAQTVDCPRIVQQALAAADSACLDTGRNQVCYGNIVLSAESQPDAGEFTFDQAGDRVQLELIKSLILSPMNKAANTWGVALLKVQANLPATLPGQNVTFLMFGDVTINNAQTSRRSVRSFATLRPTITPNPAQQGIEYGPMQAFYFKTGARDAPCAEAPDSGILIQTPKGAGKIDLLANEVQISLGSTVYLQAQPAGDMLISVVEGQATVTAQGITVVALAGSRVRIPLNNNLAPAGPPAAVEPYVAADLAALPLPHLPDVVVAALPLTADQIAALTLLATPTAAAPGSAPQGGVPLSGKWCPTVTGCTGGVSPTNLTFTVEDDGAVLILAYGGGEERYTRNEANVYFWQQGSNEAVLTVIAPDHITIAYTFAGGNTSQADWTLLEAAATG